MDAKYASIVPLEEVVAIAGVQPGHLPDALSATDACRQARPRALHASYDRDIPEPQSCGHAWRLLQQLYGI